MSKFLLLCLLNIIIINASSNNLDNIKCLNEHNSFKLKFQKKYKSIEEHDKRFNIFCNNLEKINEINNRNTTWTAGVNAFSDLTWSEFKEQFGIINAPQNCSATTTPQKPVKYTKRMSEPPAAKDWRNETCGEKSCVSMVKNQGTCGSCWTFSTVGTLEAVHAIKTNKTMLLFSEQQLVDCAQNFDNNGCDGGLPSQAFEYIKYNGGLDSEKEYPYVCGDGHCKPFSGPCQYTKDPTIQITSSFNFTVGDETTMKKVVGLQHPVSVAFQVLEDFMLYQSGIYSSKVCKHGPADVNHAVVAVGYGVDQGVNFWTIKNSWSAAWGNQGYFNIKRDVNMCGIATCASYPVLK